MDNSLIGIALFAIAGLFSASFYSPLKFVKNWRWEVMWIFYAVMACLVAPILIATLTIPTCWAAIGQTEFHTLAWTFLYGAMWGVGGLTFGLSMRYLGIGLGTAVALGFCSLVGALWDPVKNGTLLEIASTKSGMLVLVGIFICALGIAINGVAGILKENDSSDNTSSNPDFNLVKGFAVAIFAGFMSACMNVSLIEGAPIASAAKDLAIAGGADAALADLFQNNATLVVTLLGGFLTNFIWCFYLSLKTGSIKDIKTAGAFSGVIYLILCTLGGFLWFSQFFFFGMGKTKIAPDYAFASWPILMAFIIIFAGIIGLLLGEWKGSKAVTKAVLWLGILVLASSTFVMAG